MLHTAKSPPLSHQLAGSGPSEDWCELPEREEQRGPRSERSDPWLGEAAVELWLRLWPRLRRLDGLGESEASATGEVGVLGLRRFASAIESARRGQDSGWEG